jgi:hypothetical protein
MFKHWNLVIGTPKIPRSLFGWFVALTTLSFSAACDNLR